MQQDTITDKVLEAGETARFTKAFIYLAWRRFRIPRDVAEDLVQAAIVTYLEVRSRYPNREEHLRILVGIFRNKCREHLATSVRATRGLKALQATANAGGADIPVAQAEATMNGGVLGELVQLEDGRRILAALARLRPPAREMLRLIGEGVSRKELIDRLGLKANTLDSRLHTYRTELKELLSQAASRD